ncbi:MAG: hypothetical protein ACT4QF_08135 [Sporichthyaceae bacterium]
MIIDLESATMPRSCRIWLDEIPESARSRALGTVSTYWKLPEGATDGPSRRAAWGFKVGLGGSGRYGFLGAEFAPHQYERLEVHVDVLEQGKDPPDPRVSAARIGLPHEYVGGVLAGALYEPALLGAGALRFRWAAVHEVDSSWEVFRLLAVGVSRLLSLPPDAGEIPRDLLPYFGGDLPASPGDG